MQSQRESAGAAVDVLRARRLNHAKGAPGTAGAPVGLTRRKRTLALATSCSETAQGAGAAGAATGVGAAMGATGASELAAGPALAPAAETGCPVRTSCRMCGGSCGGGMMFLLAFSRSQSASENSRRLSLRSRLTSDRSLWACGRLQRGKACMKHRHPHERDTPSLRSPEHGKDAIVRTHQICASTYVGSL